MLNVGDYVTRKDSEQPVTGIVEALYEHISATVRWGVSDGKVWRQEIPQDELEVISHEVLNKEAVHKNIFEEDPPLNL